MNERTTLEVIAPSVEEAVRQGLADLGLPEDAIEVEVLDSGNRGLFGLGGRQVRVRLTVKQAQSSGSDAGQLTPVPAIDAVKQGETETDDVLGVAEKVVVELLDMMKVTASVSTHFGDMDEEDRRPVCVDIHGDDLGVLIGRHAEILNALQYILNLIVSKKVEHWVQIIVDVEGYRTRREHQLRQMALRMAEQAIKTGRRQVLEPMPASDRRIIHLELRDHPDVTTLSVGEEPGRKITIVPK